MKRILFSTLLLFALCAVFVFGTTLPAVAIDGDLPPEDGQYTVRLPLVIGSGWAGEDQLLPGNPPPPPPTYYLVVTKTAVPEFKRTFEWDIDKRADQTELVLSPGQSFPVNYEVIVEKTGYSDSGFTVSGQITIYNPAPVPATITKVEDRLSKQSSTEYIEVVPDCGVTFPYELAAGGTLTCSYGPVTLPEGGDWINKAKAFTDPYGEVGHDIGGVSFAFETPTETVDECVDVYDDMGDPANPQFLGTVCAGDSPQTFSYTKDFSYEVCDAYLFKNTAWIETKEGVFIKSDEWTVTIDVPCEGGCTLTLGYWKTHSVYGPAPYDNTWAMIGEDTPFYLSGMTWYGVMYGSPSVSKYFILAPQFVAARLNVLNGASVPPEVAAALTSAETFFNAYTPAEVAASKTLSKEFVRIAELLDMYNNGDIGPGHCSE